MRKASPKTPPACTRCGQPPGALGCTARPGALRFGLEPPGEPGSAVNLATSCPACRTPRGTYHHAGCRFERRHQP